MLCKMSFVATAAAELGREGESGNHSPSLPKLTRSKSMAAPQRK